MKMKEQATKFEGCRVCGKVSDQVLSDVLRRGNGTVYYCDSCDHGFMASTINMDEKTYYEKVYRQEYSHRADAAKTNAQELFETYRNYQADRLRLLSPYLNSDTDLLEVGASAGQFLVNVKDGLRKANAIELDKECCDFLEKELHVSSDSDYLSESRFANEVYDVVCSFQVMEHVADPVQFLKELVGSTKKGGRIFVEVPNLHDPLLAVWDLEVYKQFYYHAAHLSYFTEKSLRETAKRAGVNANNIQIHFTQDYNLLNHLSWVMNQEPQKTCHVGLSEIRLGDGSGEIATWLTAELQRVGREYVDKLVAAKSTSNVMMVIVNE